MSINFYDASMSAYDLYESNGEFSRQKNIKQLGLISEVIEGASHTRYEYLMMQCALADILDNLHKGGPATQGSITINGKKVLGNSVLKSWFMLSNFGHAKNTYGDEKSLHLFSKKRSGFKTRLLAPIKEEKLRSWCRGILDNFYYHKFHYVLTAYRIYKHLPRKIEAQAELALNLELLVLPLSEITSVTNLSKLEQLRGLFKKIRDISIVSLDGHYSHTPININLMSALVSFDSIEGGVSGQKISTVLNPIRNHLHEDVYLDKNVLARQRSYEVSALKYLYTVPQTSQSYSDLIDKAVNYGLIVSSGLKLSHFCRFSITKVMQPESDFYDEFRNLTIKSRIGCKNTRAYLDVNPFTHVRYADFFIDSDFENSQLSSFIFNICELIKGQANHLVGNQQKSYKQLFEQIREISIEKGVGEDTINSIFEQAKILTYSEAWGQVNKLVFPSYRSLLWSCVNFFLKNNFRLEIEHEGNTSYENYAFKVPEFHDDFIVNRIDLAIEEEAKLDADRVHELKVIRKSAKRSFDGYKIACLVRVNICDLSKPPSSRKVTDLDGILLKVSRKSIVLELFEAKNRRGSEALAKKDLRKLLVPTLSSNAKGYVVQGIKNLGAKLVIKF